MKVKVPQSDPTLETPWTKQPMEFSRPEYWSGKPFPSPGDLPNPRIEYEIVILGVSGPQVIKKKKNQFN